MTNGGPHRIAVQCTFSRQLLAQAGGNVAFDVFMATELKRAISFQLDTYLLQGTGINAQPIGILNQPGLTSNTYGAPTTWPMVVAIIKSLEAAYIDNDNAVWVLGPSTAAKWRTAIRQASNAFYIVEDHAVGPINAYVSTLVGPSEQTILSDWSQLLLAAFGDGVDLTVDPYSVASTGEIKITAQFYYQCFIRRPTVFAVSTDSGAQ